MPNALLVHTFLKVKLLPKLSKMLSPIAEWSIFVPYKQIDKRNRNWQYWFQIKGIWEINNKKWEMRKINSMWIRFLRKNICWAIVYQKN